MNLLFGENLFKYRTWFCAPRTAFKIPAQPFFDVNFERHLNVLESYAVYLNRNLTQEGKTSCFLRRFIKMCFLYGVGKKAQI